MKSNVRLATSARQLCFVASLLAGILIATPANASCSPESALRERLTALKQTKWQLSDDAQRQALALDLLHCLGAPDPVLRDELAFEALSAWMRGKQLSAETVRLINTKLQQALSANKANPSGLANATDFQQPFAALALAEVARVDRIQALLSEAELDTLIATATQYLTQIRDYRGFAEGEGWRHGVAHAADVMLQLSLNPRLTRSQSDRMLVAIASQITPAGGHFYRYHEGERLMAPVFYLARRDNITALDWEAWISALVEPSKAQAPASQATLARRHNLAGFLMPMYFSLRESGDAGQRERLLPAVTKALKELR